jgi:hypothetical protein
MTIFGAVFGLIFFKRDLVIPYVILWIISLSIFVMSIFFPSKLSRFHKQWINFGERLRLFATPIFLSLFYFIFLTPIALALKILKKDLLDLRKNSQKSFWKNPEEESSFKDQF